MERLGVIFLSPGDVECEPSEKLESDDPLNENAVFFPVRAQAQGSLCVPGQRPRPAPSPGRVGGLKTALKCRKIRHIGGSVD